MSAPASLSSPFDFGGVFRNTFGTIGRNPAPLVVAAVTYGLIGTLISNVGQIWTGDRAFAPLQSFGVTEMIGLFGGLVISLFNFSAVPVVMADSKGEKATIAEALRAPLTVLLPALGLAVVSQIGITVGLILLIVPGVILALMWSVAVPSMYVERLGVLDALKRSTQLTGNHRGAIFGLMLVLGLISAGANLVLALPTGGLIPKGPDRYLWGALHSLFGALLSTIFAVGISQAYLELRRLKEGSGGETARVFE
ncbi:MAG: hypothetical protein JSR45_14740 [Proteobacteria bacterium]|nr:hypothetical protein [Pseudomonadota bacterium]